MNDLKNCPFCGAKAEKFSDVTFKAETGEKIFDIKQFAWCTECSALVSGDTEEEVTKNWNRRKDE